MSHISPLINYISCKLKIFFISALGGRWFNPEALSLSVCTFPTITLYTITSLKTYKSKRSRLFMYVPTYFIQLIFKLF